MADYTSHDMGAFDPDSEMYIEGQEPVSGPAKQLARLTNAAGALISVALIAGIGVWGYKLLVRDVSGIPVVRAAEGAMRVRPEDPGGQLAQHQGLSVNVVAAEGSSGKLADKLVLAPRPVDLTEDDQPVKPAMVASVPQDAPGAADAETTPTPASLDVAGKLKSGDVDGLVAQLTEGVSPLEKGGEAPADVVATVTEDVAREVQEAEAKIVAAVLDAPGVRHSLRPRKRPADSYVIQAAVQAAAAAVATPATPQEIDPASLKVGTRLVQLGAFDSPDVAREQWAKLKGRFGAYMEDKSLIVQKATSGGRVFYRLRAHGFADIAEARRFCSTLVAEKADCIPVVTR